MDLIVAVLGLGLLAVPFVALVVGLAALARAREQAQRLALAQQAVSELRMAGDFVYRRVVALEAEIASVRAAAPAAPVAPRAERAGSSPVAVAEVAAQAAPEPSGAVVPTAVVASCDEPPDAAPDEPAERGRERGAAATQDQGLERWLGVRGAAALAGVVLVMAGLYFFKFSLEHGWITTSMRVVLGTLTGVACVASSETWLRRRHELLANWIAGAGIAILYLTFWAASARYELISPALAGALMAVVTASCCVLSLERASIAIAGLGLIGGFATPLLLSTGSDRPLALFSYLALLDVGLLYVAHRRRWSGLAALALLGTTAYQGLWIVARMGEARLGWGMVVCLVFAGVFAVALAQRAREQADAPSDLDRWTLAAALLLPFGFAVYFGLEAQLSRDFTLLGAFVAMLVAGAQGYSRRTGSDWLSPFSVCGALGVLVAWLATHDLASVSAWPLMATCVVVAAILLAHMELTPPRSGAAPLAQSSALLWSLGALIVTGSAACFAATPPPLAPWLLGWLPLAAVGLRVARHDRWSAIHLVLAATAGLLLLGLGASHLGATGFVPARSYLALAAALAIVHQGLTLAFHRDQPMAHHASALLAMTLMPLVVMVGAPIALSSAVLVGLALLVGLAALRAESPAWLLALAPWAAGHEWACWRDVGASGWAYGGHVALLLLGSALPFAFDRARRERVVTWRAAAVVAPMALLPLLALHDALFGRGATGVVPLGLAVVQLAVMALVVRHGPRDPSARNSALAWTGATALGLVTLAVPLQLHAEWITIGWALMAAALMGLHRRLEHEGLKLVALLLFGVVTLRLVANPEVLGYHVRGSHWMLNWLSYTYLVPAACLALGACLAVRGAEGAQRLSPAATSLALAAVTVTFVWLNLSILDWFATGELLTLQLERMPARDLTMSIAWAAYSVALLALGMWTKSVWLRRVSLALILATCAKVFLYDLANLEDMYRVLSLVGLALSLIAVSLVYQRFVFRELAAESS